VIFPLADDAAVDDLGGNAVDRDFEAETPPIPRYRDRLTGLPEAVRRELPRAFDVVGEIVLVRLRPSAEPHGAAIGAALLATVPGARTVGWDLGVHGPERRRTLRHLAGRPGWRTRHRENGLLLDVDVEAAYFSPRLAREHARIAGCVEPGQRVLDLACGVGPFALTIARDGRASSIVAVDRNPVAIELLRSSSARLGPAGSRIEPRIADLTDVAAAGIVAHRVIFNLPHGGIKYLTSVAATVEPAGTLHYYEMTDRALAPARPDALLETLGRDRFSAGAAHVVHPYAPTIDLVAYTFHRRAA